MDPGDAIKLAAGTYDLAGVDIERLALGKEGVRGGYSAEDHFRIQNAETNPTRVSGVPDEMRNNFIAHGFIVLDANGDPLPRIEMAKLLAPTACTGGRAGSFPCHNIDYLAQVQLAEIPTQPTSASNLWGFVDLDDNREYAVLGHRNGTVVVDVTVPGTPGHRRQHSRQCLVVARGEGVPGSRPGRRPASRLRLHQHRGAGRRPADHRSHQPAHQHVAGQHAHRVQHLAHAVHLERRLRDR